MIPQFVLLLVHWSKRENEFKYVKMKKINLSLKNKKKFLRVICSFFIKSGDIEVFLTFPRKKRKKIKKTRNHTKNFFLFLTEKAGKFFRLKGTCFVKSGGKKILASGNL